MLWWIILVLIAILAYYKLYKPHQYWKERNVFYIKPVPILGNISNLVFRSKPPADDIQDTYNTYDARYFGTYMFLKPTFFIKDVDLIKNMFVKHFDHFVDRNQIFTEEMDHVLGRGLFFLQGQRWRDMRATLSPAFTSSKMRSMFVLITECAEHLTNHFEKNIKTNEIKTIEMKDVTMRYTCDVIATCAFGIKCDSLEERENEFYVVGKKASTFKGWKALKFLGFILIPSIMKFFKIQLFTANFQNYFRKLVTGMMEYREKEGIVRPDMIHLLMLARKGVLKHEEDVKKEEDTGFATVEESQVGRDTMQKKYKLTDDDLTAQAVLFFAAGFDTSSILLSFMAYELALNENVQRKLQEEIDITMMENEGKVSYETILKMKYLDMVVSETLRKWPPIVGLDRLCVKPYTVEPTELNESPVLIEKGMVAWLGIYPLHRDPKYFPDPERFYPERFNDENKKNIVPFSYLPFGIGPRNCIGSRFALLEAKAMFAYLLAKFDIVVVKETEIPLTLDKTGLINMTAANGFWLGLRLREK